MEVTQLTNAKLVLCEFSCERYVLNVRSSLTVLLMINSCHQGVAIVESARYLCSEVSEILD